jgi:hypothetical protein
MLHMNAQSADPADEIWREWGARADGAGQADTGMEGCGPQMVV